MSPDAKSDDPATHVRGSEGRRLWLVESATLPTLDGEEAQETLLKLFLGDEPSSR